VGAGPAAVGVVPKGVEEWRELRGLVGGEVAEFGGGHGSLRFNAGPS
jgi:hypothetical protein